MCDRASKYSINSARYNVSAVSLTNMRRDEFIYKDKIGKENLTELYAYIKETQSRIVLS